MLYSLILLAYLLGSLNSAILVCRCFRLPSPLETGSKNPGATNVLRMGGKIPAALTFAGDVLKGILPVLLGKALGISGLWLGMIGLAATLGHIFPIYFKFKGGKGVATAIGVIFALNLWLGLYALITWNIIALLFRYSSLASLISLSLSVVIAHFFLAPELTWPLLIMTLIIIGRHHANIRRLLQGTESRLGQKSKTAS